MEDFAFSDAKKSPSGPTNFALKAGEELPQGGQLQGFKGQQFGVEKVGFESGLRLSVPAHGHA